MDKQITVMIADDNVFFRETLRFVLSVSNTITLLPEAKNGEEAIAFAAEFNPDIIIMDINMSPVNGFEATRKILKHNPLVKIIAVSMHREPSYCKNMLRLGAKGYLTKGASHNEIIVAIREVAAGGKYIETDLRDIL